MYQEVHVRNSLTGAPMELMEVDAVTVFMGKTVNYRRAYYYSPETGNISTTPEQDEENHRRMEMAAAGQPLDADAHSYTVPAESVPAKERSSGNETPSDSGKDTAEEA